MKKEIHPENYRPVVFEDATAGERFLTRSTVDTEKTITWDDGNEYPLYTLAISSYSHPFYTGSQRLVDTEGRIDKFRKKYAKKEPPKKKKKSA
ncbi:MAG: type B 50S ribosomal protein L31 [Bdellovibrionales bacterium]|nr:type B 50S ribosomal protein L31 [Bdellovibrionales bacterium]